MLTLDPLLNLSFALHAAPGRYALLLGSGVSRPAGIPTGWEIVTDLLTKVAAASGVSETPDPLEWYKAQHGSDPDYGDLLEALGKTPAERLHILKSYFERDDPAHETPGSKLPTEAHRTVAKLCRDGFIKVVVTTNFDRLLETALRELGEDPTIISTTDAVAGALPIVHVKTTIIKINGDYGDIRIRNTRGELESYDKEFTDLLERVFDEFGLIIVGWSADWDQGLRSLLERRTARRFSTYWATRSPLSGVGQSLSSHLDASIITIKDADTFFPDIYARVQALAEIGKPHPLSAKMATSTLKTCISDPTGAIKLSDLISRETDSALAKISSNAVLDVPGSFTVPELHKRLKVFEASTETLRALFAVGLYWFDKRDERPWIDALSRVSNIATPRSGDMRWTRLPRYPALLLLYAGGIGALANGRYGGFGALLRKAKYRFGESGNFYFDINTSTTFDGDVDRYLPHPVGGYYSSPSPDNEYLHAVLRADLRECIPDDSDYDDMFDLFEYYCALIYGDQRLSGVQLFPFFAPIGRFAWRPRCTVEHDTEELIDKQGGDFPLIKLGYFGGSITRLKEVKAEVDKFARQCGFRR